MNGGSSTIGVVGGGAWGTALANAAAAAGNDVILYTREPGLAQAMRDTRENAQYLPGIHLHDAVGVTSALADAAQAKAVLVVTPAQSTSNVTQALAPLLDASTPLVLCAKGIERGSGRFLIFRQRAGIACVQRKHLYWCDSCYRNKYLRLCPHVARGRSGLHQIR
jgi:glycerol-3-phosphate dehydrogenase (NAD(P)+)